MFGFGLWWLGDGWVGPPRELDLNEINGFMRKNSLIFKWKRRCKIQTYLDTLGVESSSDVFSELVR